MDTPAVHQEALAIPVTGGRSMRAFLAAPAHADSARPGLLVIHEILGLNADIRRIAARFAEAGYVALAPDLFAGPGPRALCLLRALTTLRRRGGPLADDLLAARDWLAGRPEVAGDRIGVAGFCLGGGFAVLLASLGPFAVAAPFYGEVPRRTEDLRDVCPVVAGFGGRDRVFAAHGRRLQQHLAALGVPHDVEIYPDAGHSYMSPREPGLLLALGALGPLHAQYDEAAAEDSWRRMLAFFATHLEARAGGAEEPPSASV